jgi:aminoglycoside phosphotransferase family enzyme/predicted kinase
MKNIDILESLKKPAFFGSNVQSVEIIQTHISFVALTGQYAYKVKKPVDYGFLDFSTIEKRKYFCQEELRLNKRLCPNIYIDVLPITRDNGKLKLNGDGEPVDYTLKMKQFSQDEIMTNLIKQRKICKNSIKEICNILIHFYKSQRQFKNIDRYGELDEIKKNINENFNQTKSLIDITIKKSTYDYIKKNTSKFIEIKKHAFKNRIRGGHIRDCHGDLHSGNIVISNDDIYIFDCIEFNKRFRYCDTASDIGFLAMDLDYLNKPYLSSYLINQYIKKSRDYGILDVLNFYKSYRAYVRGKVIGFKLKDTNIPKNLKQEIIKTTHKYFELSRYYAALLSVEVQNKKPLLFIVSGLTGTGKSTLSSKISIDYNTHIVNTDVIRKEIAGIDKYERHHDEINTGLYSSKKIDYTYEKVIEKASDYLKTNENVLLDATFQKRKYRDMARNIAKENDALLIIIQCICSEYIAKKWLKERLKKRTVSDGRWEIYMDQKKNFEPFSVDENFINIDTSKKSYKGRMDSFKKILSKVKDDKK